VLVDRCLRRDVYGVITSITVAEYCHRRMMQEAQSRGLSGSNPARALAQDAALVRRLVRYRQEVEDLLAGDLLVVATEHRTTTEADARVAVSETSSERNGADEDAVVDLRFAR